MHEDSNTGALHQPPEKAARAAAVPPGAVCRYVYAMMEGIRLGYLSESYSGQAELAWHSIQVRFIDTTTSGAITLTNASQAGGSSGEAAGASSAVDGSLPGALLMAATEADLAPTSTIAHGPTVMLDAWYNSQQWKNATGQSDYFRSFQRTRTFTANSITLPGGKELVQWLVQQRPLKDAGTRERSQAKP